ncbi:mechanosensitive ion channel family protein [Halobacteriovorax sp. HLS]|uniref:mechanosensitive ion channel family protein n=1 Tax=Halobacteriovorax sp. HLS TaxID=2234000 RepID=UPI0013E2F2FF|nr:mechanosensitive ion channel domain-containing protein [Halobacteriovorax sp. HLS]
MSSILNNSKSMSVDRKRKYFVNVNSATTFLIVFTALFIWNEEIRSLAFSLAAILVAIVLACKELILNFMGGIFKLTQNSFHVGDRIEVAGIRGDVIDRTLFSTTLLEVGPGMETHQLTGRSVIVPNSIFLTNTLINESYSKNYVLHTFKIPLQMKADWARSEKKLLELCEIHCSDYFEQAQEHFNALHRRSHLELPILKPRVHINIITPKRIDLIVRITAPAAMKGRVEQRILKDFLTSDAYITQISNG